MSNQNAFSRHYGKENGQFLFDADAEEDSSSRHELCYQFPLKDFTLNITKSTIHSLNRFVVISGFKNLDIAMISTVFLNLASDGLIDKRQFDNGVSTLLSLNDSLKEVDRINCTMTLSAIFYAFDHTESNVVDVAELLCGFAVICEGSKSSKLAYAFDLIDEDQDGILTKRGLWRYFRSFLCSLLTVCGTSLDMTSDDLKNICNDCAVFTASQLLKATDLTEHEESGVIGCTFENLADWYTTGGYQVATWLELLDLSKWLPLQLSNTDYEYDEPDQESQEATVNLYGNDELGPEPGVAPSLASSYSQNPYCEDDGMEIFRSELPGGNKLVIMESDTNFVVEIAQLTAFCNLDPQKLIQKLFTFSRGGVVSINSYNNFVKTVVPPGLSAAEVEKISFALSSIYYSYDDDGEHEALFSSLATGLCVLCKGSKSSKLILSFSLFDSDSDGFLTQAELQLFLGAYLRLLLGCSFSTSSTRKYGDTSSIVIKACHQIVQEIFKSGITQVDFQYFGDWYNDGGFKVIPWLELIDLSKWVVITANSGNISIPVNLQRDAVAPAAAHAPSYNSKITSPEAERIYSLETDEAEEEAQPLFTLMLHRSHNSHIITISPDTVRSVHALAIQSGFSNLNAEDVSFGFLSNTSDDGLLTRRDYDRQLQRIKPNRRKEYLTHSEFYGGFVSPLKDKNNDMFQKLFQAFDRTGSGVVDSREVTCGLSILCYGTKSTKLAAAFDLLDEDGDGVISRRGLWKYFRSFLCALLTLSGTADELTGEDELTIIVDGTALYACDSVLSTSLNGSSSVTFDDIADWYTSTGYHIAPWLELLDMSKWHQLINSE